MPTYGMMRGRETRIAATVIQSCNATSECNSHRKVPPDMYYPEAARTVPRHNAGGGASLAGWNSWGSDSLQAGRASGASSNFGSHLTTEAYRDQTRQLFAPDNPCSSRPPTEKTVQGKKTKAKGKLGPNNTRWGNHNKKTCKCAVCMQIRGESKSSWYNHDQTTCVCAVCKQSRGESKPRDGHHAFTPPLCKKDTSVPGNRGSWFSLQEPIVACGACGSERRRCGGLEQSPGIEHQLPTFRSSNTAVKSCVTPLQLFPESSTPIATELSWQQQLSNLKAPADGSSALGIPSNSSPWVAPTPKCIFDAHYDRLTTEQTLGFSYNAETLKANQQELRTNSFSNPSFTGWPNADPTCGRNFTTNNSDVSHKYSNLGQSWEAPTVLSCNGNPGVPWQKNTINACQVGGRTSAGLQDSGSLQSETRTPNLPWEDMWEPVEETVSAISNVAERIDQCTPSPYSHILSMDKAELDVAVPPFSSYGGAFHRPGRSASFFGENLSPMVPLHPASVAPANACPEIDGKAAYVSNYSNHQLSTLSGRSSLISDFPFGLDIEQPASDLNEPLQGNSMSINCDQSTTGSSSPPFEFLYPTSMLHENENSPQAMDIDSECITDSSCVILQRGKEKLMLPNERAVGEQPKPQQPKSVRDKRVKPTNAAGQQFSKHSVDLGENTCVVHQKGTKRKQAAQVLDHPAPKWRQLIHHKYDHSTVIRKICIRTRVPKKCPQSSVFKLFEPSLVNDVENGNAGGPPCPAQETYVKCRSRLEESSVSVGFQSTDPTNMRQPTHVTSRLEDPVVVAGLQSTNPTSIMESMHVRTASGELISSQRELNEQIISDGLLDTDCSQGFAFSSKRKDIGTSPDIKSKGDDRVQKTSHFNSCRTMPELREIQHTAPVASHSSASCTVLHCNDHSHKKSKAAELDVLAKRVRIIEACGMDDLLGRKVQLADPVIQDVLAKFGLGPRGTGRPKAEVETCIQGTGQIQQRHGPLVLDSEDMRLLHPAKKQRRSYHGASVTKSLLCMNVVSLFKGDPARNLDLACKMLELLSKPQAMKSYYLDDTYHAKTSPRLAIQLTELGRSKRCQSLINYMVDSSFLFLDTCTAGSDRLHSKLRVDSVQPMCSAYFTPFAALYNVLKLVFCEKSTGLATWPRIHQSCNTSEAKGNHSPNSQLEILIDLIISWILTRQDSAFYRRPWLLSCTSNSFGLPPLSTVEQISCNPLERMTQKIFNHSCLRIILCSFLAQNDVNDCAVSGSKITFKSLRCTKTHHKRNHAIDQQSFTDRVGLIPLRELFIPYYIDKPLHIHRCLTRTSMLSKRNLLRLISVSDGTEQYVTLKEEQQMAKDKLVPPHCLRVENQEIRAEQPNREQKIEDGVTLEEDAPHHVHMVQTGNSCSINTKHPVQSLMEHGQTDLYPSLHGDCTTSTKQSSHQTVPANSFQDLLKSVLQVRSGSVASPPLMSNCQSIIDSNETTHQIHSSDSVPSSSIASPLVKSNCQCVIDSSETIHQKHSSDTVCSSIASPPLMSNCQSVIDSNDATHQIHSSESVLSSIACNCQSVVDSNEATHQIHSSDSVPSSIACPPLMSNCQSVIDSNQTTHQMHASDCVPTIPSVDVWEGHSCLRTDGQTSASLRCSTTSFSNPVRRRGCPKGGWPKKDKRKRVLDVNATSQQATVMEVDIEVLQPTVAKLSTKENSEYKRNLDRFLNSPFAMQELQDLEELATIRKPLLRLRETRQRVLHVATKRDGMSYLDHHPDLARKVVDAGAPEEKLRLLRGFFFWLQHACTPGSFKPWAPHMEEAEEVDDCVEIFPQEGVVNHVHKEFSEDRSTITQTGFQIDPVKVREGMQRCVGHMILRPRGRKRKSSKKLAKHIKTTKPPVSAMVKRECR